MNWCSVCRDDHYNRDSYYGNTQCPVNAPLGQELLEQLADHGLVRERAMATELLQIRRAVETLAARVLNPHK